MKFPWAKRASYPKYVNLIQGKKLNLGCGCLTYPGMINADKFDGPGVDIKFDAFVLGWPFSDNEFSYVYSGNFLEHIPHSNDEYEGEFWFHFINEILRIIKPNGYLEIVCPHRNNPVSLDSPGHTRVVGIDHFMGWIQENLDGNEPRTLTRYKLKLIKKEISWAIPIISIRQRWIRFPYRAFTRLLFMVIK